MTQTFHSPVVAILAVAALAGALSACVPLVLGGAALGTMMAVDRRTSGAQLEDEGIELRSASRLRTELGDRTHVNITSYNRQVLLTGEVPNERDKQAVEQVVAGVDNVKSIINELAITGISNFRGRSSDVLLEGKVKATLVDARDVFAGAIKVVAERGNVYLMGRVSLREADRVTQLTRTVSGVQRVVRVFEIISEEELQRVAAPPRPAASGPRN